jgi:SAM-dependent methyltransferase
MTVNNDDASRARPQTASARATQIRKQLTVLSDGFRNSYLDYFQRLQARVLDESEVPTILSDVAVELEDLQLRHRTGQITDAGLAYGRTQIRDLLNRLVDGSELTTRTKGAIDRLVMDSIPQILLGTPGRYTQDWFSYHEEHWSRHFGHLSGRPGLQAVEIGSFEGRSACWIVQNLLTGENSRLICVDPFADYLGQEANFDHNVLTAGCGERIVKLRGRSHQLLPHLAAESFDFIYVDGSHQMLDVLQDAAMCWRLVRSGGLLVFDDYEHSLFPDSFGMSAGPAIDTFLAAIHGEYEPIFQDWQVAVRKTQGRVVRGPDRMPSPDMRDLGKRNSVERT